MVDCALFGIENEDHFPISRTKSRFAGTVVLSLIVYSWLRGNPIPSHPCRTGKTPSLCVIVESGGKFGFRYKPSCPVICARAIVWRVGLSLHIHGFVFGAVVWVETLGCLGESVEVGKAAQ